MQSYNNYTRKRAICQISVFHWRTVVSFYLNVFQAVTDNWSTRFSEKYDNRLNCLKDNRLPE